MRKKLTPLINFISIVALYGSLEWHWLAIFNVFLALIWLGTLNIYTDQILTRIFNLSKNYTRLLGIFLNIFLVGFIGNIFTSWWAFDNLTFSTALILTSLFIYFWSFKFKLVSTEPRMYLGNNDGFWNFKSKYLLIFFGLILIGFYLINVSKTGQYISSPWQVLPVSYLVTIFLVLLMTFALIFSKQKVWLILLAVIMTSFLMHAYLLVYAEGFGGDRWRHLGSENRILSEMVYQPTLKTNDIWYQSVVGISIPKALIAGPKISYGFEWTLVMIVSKITEINIFDLDKYLILGLWSIFLPIITFVSVFQLRQKKLTALLAAGLTLSFYLLQYYGAQTLPISFSAIYFMFLVGYMLAYIKNKDKNFLFFLISLSTITYFGYSLAFIITIIALIWVLAQELVLPKKVLVFGLLSLSIFIVEVATSFSSLAYTFSIENIFNNIFIKSDFLFFETGQIFRLPHIIWPYLAGFVGLIFLGTIILFTWQLLKSKYLDLVLLAGLNLILIFNYLLSWIFLDGLHTLSRRMNIFMILVMLIILAYGVMNYINTKFRAGVMVVIVSLVTLFTFASGPALEATVTTDNTQSMKYIWSQVKNQPESNCILADTWPLLALESYSSKEIVAGNFSSDFDYNQNDRVRLLNDFTLNPTLNVIEEAMTITKTSTCFVLINYYRLDEIKVNLINELLGNPILFGDDLVWKYK